MLDQSYYEKAAEIIDHYGRKASSLIPIMQEIRKNTVICPESCSLSSQRDRRDRGQGLQCSNLL